MVFLLRLSTNEDCLLSVDMPLLLVSQELSPPPSSAQTCLSTPYILARGQVGTMSTEYFRLSTWFGVLEQLSFIWASTNYHRLRPKLICCGRDRPPRMYLPALKRFQ